jgi:ectoine hydroxylase-related dioxygenase (phytanoyl-CoA dioxygenase family)
MTISATIENPTRDGKVLTLDQLRLYHDQGYLIVEGLFDANQIERIKALRFRAEKKAMAQGGSFRDGKVEYQAEPVQSDPTGKVFALRKVQEAFLGEPDFAEVTASERVLDIVEDLIGPEIYYFSSKLMFKPAHGGSRKPWHQDFAYWAETGTRQVTVWGAIDPATQKNGCIQVIPESHKKGLLKHHQWEDYMIDEDTVKDDKVVYAEMNSGDVLFFNVLTLHASDPNRSDQPRLSTIVDFDSEPGPPDKPFGSQVPLRTAKT